MCGLTKKCSACLEEKTINNFTKNSRNTDKLENKCKVCYRNKVPPFKDNTEVIIEGKKVCCVCKENKSISLFNRNKKKNSSFLKMCKACYKNEMAQNSEIRYKKCTLCCEVKNLESFYVDSIKKYGRKSRCKECVKENKKVYEVSVVEKRCCICGLLKESKDFTRNTDVKDGLNSYCKVCANINSKKYKKDKEKLRNSFKDRMSTDSNFKLSCNTRNIIYQSFNRSCKGTYKKSDKTENILGCTIQEFIEHLQSLFTEGMTLENNGKCEECWHIDHKIPLATAKTEEDIIKLCHYTNLQPLWRNDNLSKGKKIV